MSDGSCVSELKGHTDSVSAMCLLGDGRWASGCFEDAVIRIRNVSTSPLVPELKGHTGSVSCLCVLGDGRLASGGGYFDSVDAIIRIWDVANGSASEYVGDTLVNLAPNSLISNYICAQSELLYTDTPIRFALQLLDGAFVLFVLKSEQFLFANKLP